MGTVPEIEDDDLETATDKCFACGDFGKAGELWYRCTGCESGRTRSAAVGTSPMVTHVTFTLRCSGFLQFFILTEFNSGLFHCDRIVYSSSVMPAYVYISGLGNIKL
jgi:hypothetical protein